VYGVQDLLVNLKWFLIISIGAMFFWGWQIYVQQQICIELIDEMQAKIDE